MADLIPIGQDGDFKVFNQFDGLYHHRDGSLEESDGTILKGANKMTYQNNQKVLGKLPKKLQQKKGEERTHYDDEESYPYGMFKQKHKI